MNTNLLILVMSKNLDKFYTKPEIVTLCYQQLPALTIFDLIIEPSAGNGAFLQPLLTHQPPLCPYKAYDIAPEGPNITSADFLSLPSEQLRSTAQHILTVGNPPFGRNCSVALQFLKHAMTYSAIVGFILPRSFKKISLQQKVPLTFELQSTIDLPVDSFLVDGISYNVPCVFQVWRKTLIPRQREVSRTTSQLFTFTTPEQAQLSIRRVGIYAGRAYPTIDKSPSSHYFIAVAAGISVVEFIEKCNSIVWDCDNTTGPRSISKGELIAKVEEIWHNR